MGSRKKVKDDERMERTIRGLLKLPENKRYINCNFLGPQYVCTTSLTFVCTNCSGIHQEFTHRVKSISLGKFSEEEVTALQAAGNERARQIYFKAWDPQVHSFPDGSNLHKLRDFIRQIYVERRYAGEREVGRGNKAMEILREQGLRNAHFFPLDVSSVASINDFVSWLRTTFQVLDILVSNAAVSFNEIDENSVEHAETVIRTNYHGTKLLTESLLPLFFRSNSVSRILNISSRLGSINKMRNLGIKATLQKENQTEQEIEQVLEMFAKDVKKGRWEGSSSWLISPGTSATTMGG